MTIVINTPNSHIGRRVTERLLDSEMPVSIITRNPDKVRDLAVQGASLLVGSCDDEELLSRAFEGAEAVFWLTPPNYPSGLPKLGTRHRVESRHSAS